MTHLDPQVITTLNELRSLIGGEPQSLSLSVSVDPGGRTYSVTTSDSAGNSDSVSQRIAS